jgi:SAM-dependent methyltransferase
MTPSEPRSLSRPRPLRPYDDVVLPEAPAGFPASPQDDADVALTLELADLLAHDRRGVALPLAVRGRVAHVRGEVDSEEERQVLRRLLRRLSGVHAVWDLLSLPGQELCVVDLGCGARKQVAGAVGVDREPMDGVDVVADAQERLPFDRATVDHVFAIHVLEHLTDLLGAMRELHRVLRPTGVLHVLTPHWHSVTAVGDPTHCRLMDVQTFKYFCSRRPGVVPWRPLAAGVWDGTVHADLQPVAEGEPAPSPLELARWFR